MLTYQMIEMHMPVEQARKFNVVSMFSGCGGMDLGFLGGFNVLGQDYSRHPFEIIWANDFNPKASETYKFNLGHDIRVGDVWQALASLPTKADVIIGGFPCQDISVNNKNARGIDGARSGLYRAMVEAIGSIKPEIFIAENVKALLFRNNAPSLDRLKHDFDDVGYDVTIDLYNAANFGVAQTRERVFIVGTRKGEEAFTKPDPVLGAENWITAKSAIGDLEPLDWDDEFSHIWSLANKSPDQGSRRLKESRPGYTIRAECHGNIQYHYNLPRRMSMREAARIQSFPDDFLFQAKLRETERQIGNAVPPVLAWHIARKVSEYLT